MNDIRRGGVCTLLRFLKPYWKSGRIWRVSKCSVSLLVISISRIFPNTSNSAMGLYDPGCWGSFPCLWRRMTWDILNGAGKCPVARDSNISLSLSLFFKQISRCSYSCTTFSFFYSLTFYGSFWLHKDLVGLGTWKSKDSEFGKRNFFFFVYGRQRKTLFLPVWIPFFFLF